MTLVDLSIWMMAALVVKHFVCDFPLQWRYQYANKGTYGHPGGLLHAGIHAVGTAAALASAFWLSGFAEYVPLSNASLQADIIIVAFLEALVHYHIDWAKMKINATMGWGPANSEQFWWSLGVDQLLHYFTYLFVVVYFIYY